MHRHMHSVSEYGITYRVLGVSLSPFHFEFSLRQLCTATRSEHETEDLMQFISSPFHHINTAA